MATAKKNDPVDLATFDEAIKRQDEGVLVPIKGMDGRTPLGFSVRIAGPDSERAAIAQEELTEKLFDEERLDRLSAREALDREIAYLAKITMGWEPKIIMDGEEIAYTEANAEKLYRRFKFIREQVNRAGGKRALFTKG